MIASFGSLVFTRDFLSGGIPIGEFSQTMSLSVDTKEQTSGKPLSTIKGAELEQMEISLQINRYSGIVPEEFIETLRSFVEEGTPSPFILAGKPVGKNNWVLTGVSISDVVLGKKGKILSAAAALTFQEYVPDTFKAAAVATGGVAPAQKTSSIAVSDPYKVQTASKQTKASLKRKQGVQGAGRYT